MMAPVVRHARKESQDDQFASMRQEFETLFQRCHRRAYNAAFRMMGNSSDAEDLTQEAFVRVWSAFDRYDRARPFEGWLFRILSNLAIDRWRRLSAATVCSLDAESAGIGSSSSHLSRSVGGSYGGRGATLLSYLADERTLPEQFCLRAETGRRVRRALLTLPFDYRKAVVLADVQGYSYEEIAQHLGCPVGTIRSRLHRGRQMLRQNLLKLQTQEEAGEFDIPFTR